MGDLAFGVDAGVGAAGAADRNGLAAQRKKRALDRLLHGKPIGLPLPADKGAPSYSMMSL